MEGESRRRKNTWENWRRNRNTDPELARKGARVVGQMEGEKPNRVHSLPSSLPSNFLHFHRKAPIGRGGGGGVARKCQLARREKKYFAFIRTVIVLMTSLRRKKAAALNAQSVFQTVRILSNGSVPDSDTFTDMTA